VAWEGMVKPKWRRRKTPSEAIELEM
jgi:hypothetical protein